MEESLPDGENVSSDSSKKLDSGEGTPRCHHSDSISQAEEEGEGGKELAEELTEEAAEELTKGPTECPAKETTEECPTWGESHYLGASEKLKKEWSSIHQKKRLTTCVEDLVGTETGIQEDYRGDEHGCSWLCKTSTRG